MNKKRLLIILLALAIADLLGAIDGTAVNIALPTITRDFGIPITLSQWIPNAYTVVLVSMLIFMGRIGDIIGPKRLYLIGLVIFGAASLALGFINSTYPLIIVRGLQGLGTAILYTMPMAIIAHLWAEREKAFGVTASFFAAGMLVGPLVGGLLTGISIGTYQGWHLIFLLNIPFIIFGLIIAAKFIPELPARREQKIDYWSVLLLFGALITVILSLTIISKCYLIVGGLLLVLLYLYERRIKFPLVDFSLFRNRTFFAANMVSFIGMVVTLGMSFVLTFYLQDILGWSSAKAGIAFLPVPIATGIASALASRMRNWKLAALITAFSALVSMLMLTLIKPTISYYELILPALLVIAIGDGVLMTVGFASIIGSADKEKSGSASGILNTLQQLGALIGVALVAGIALQYTKAFWILAAVAAVGVIAAMFVKQGSEKYQKV